MKINLLLSTDFKYYMDTAPNHKATLYHSYFDYISNGKINIDSNKYWRTSFNTGELSHKIRFYFDQFEFNKLQKEHPNKTTIEILQLMSKPVEPGLLKRAQVAEPLITKKRPYPF